MANYAYATDGEFYQVKYTEGRSNMISHKTFDSAEAASEWIIMMRDSRKTFQVKSCYWLTPITESQLHERKFMERELRLMR